MYSLHNVFTSLVPRSFAYAKEPGDEANVFSIAYAYDAYAYVVNKINSNVHVGIKRTETRLFQSKKHTSYIIPASLHKCY